MPVCNVITGDSNMHMLMNADADVGGMQVAVKHAALACMDATGSLDKHMHDDAATKKSMALQSKLSSRQYLQG